MESQPHLIFRNIISFSHCLASSQLISLFAGGGEASASLVDAEHEAWLAAIGSIGYWEYMDYVGKSATRRLNRMRGSLVRLHPD